ncbi:MAG: hypothetical protein WDZ46_06800 [Solirubrobacterales bacterium]
MSDAKQHLTAPIAPIRFALALFATICAALFLASSASAAAPTYDSSFTCSVATPCGSITSGFSPDQLAVNEATGDVYVIDIGHDAIVVFDSTGAYKSTIPGSSTTAGTFKLEEEGWVNDIAIDNSGGASSGQIYVVSEAASVQWGGSGAVYSFAGDGTYLWQSDPDSTIAVEGDFCGGGVDANGVPYAVEFSNGLIPLDPETGAATAAPLYSILDDDSCQIAFDSENFSYAHHWDGGDGGHVDKYTPEGTFFGTLDSGANFDVAVDRTSDEVYLARADEVAVYDSLGAPVAGTPFGSAQLSGGKGFSVGAHSTTNRIYVSDPGQDQVHIYDGLPVHELVVSRDGTGSGTVTSSPSGIDCGSDCQQSFDEGTTVTLTAVADANSTFAGWTGCDSTSGEECTVTIGSETEVAATFDLTHQLTVSKGGSGSGTVTGTGIDCGVDCAEVYSEGTEVTLTATAAAGSTFAGWSGGGCSGTGSCVMTIGADTGVTATFDAVPPPPAPPVAPPAPPVAPSPPPAAGKLLANGVAQVKGSRVLLKVRCRGAAGARCTGVAKLTARVKQGKKQRNLVIGKTRYNLPTNSTLRVIRPKLTGKGKQLVRKAGRRGLKAKLVGSGLKNRVVKLKAQSGKKKG